jgi:hypothetical protein
MLTLDTLPREKKARFAGQARDRVFGEAVTL